MYAIRSAFSALPVVLGIIAAITLTVILCVKVLPAKYNGTFTKKPLQALHDYFNFKKLYLETILKVIFAFASIFCIANGILVATLGNLISVIDIIRFDYNFADVLGSVFRNFIMGVGIAVLMPIALRLVYEGILMFVLLVKNTIEINNKLK